jgi:hypothetical protein
MTDIIDDTLKRLILAYMDAKNAENHALAEKLLYDINQIRTASGKDTTNK